MAAFAPPPLDETFIKDQTGINDPDELKRHIITVQTKAYNLFQYRCIHSFSFIRTRITRPGRERDGAILLDLGCCFGTDIRKAASDGFPIQNLIASDLRADFWNLGHELFRSTPATCPIAFVAGDALDPGFLQPTAPAVSPPEAPAPPLASLMCLTPLRGHVAALHTSAVFHLFLEPEQLQLARAVASLISPVPGSVIFGSHIGRSTKSIRQKAFSREDNLRMFCHSPESWAEMWGKIFPAGTVQVEAQLNVSGADSDTGILAWSVTRL
ncbi:hypothetical protein B0H17DRAFT_1156887 [Mycena rosella]|uniref:Methyltransferase domain-containing protein n=1 Tax=Mycena rosella TaxID=1033263 RepID=A0AAD7M8M7_MYCRO|nr:hypothetical protein B0H17DRAFT_1156887 [Mycena rosella]